MSDKTSFDKVLRKIDKLTEHDEEIPLSENDEPPNCGDNCLWSEIELPCLCPEAAKQLKAVLRRAIRQNQSSIE
jgi:hypothetical protein